MSIPLYPRPYTNTAAANTEVVISLAAITDARRSIERIILSFDGNPAAGVRLTVESPEDTVLFDLDLVDAGPHILPFGKPGLRGAEGEDLIVRVAADATAVTTLNVFEGNI